MRPEREGAWVAHAAGAIFALLPIIFALMHRAVAPALYLLAVIALFHKPTRSALGEAFRAPPSGGARLFFLGAITFSVWTCVTGLWSPRPDKWSWGLSLLSVLGAGSIVFAFFRHLESRGARLLARYVAISLAVAAGLLFFEAISNGFIRQITPPERASKALDLISLGRGATAYLPLAWPAAFLVWRLTGRRAAAGAILATVFVTGALFLIRANFAAAVVGCALGALALWRPKGALLGVVGAWGLGLFAAPALALLLPPAETLEAAMATWPPSWMHRLIIWRVSADGLLAAPLGCGVECARTLGETTAFLKIFGRETLLRLLPNHPHSIFLQVWLELGPVGVAAMAVAIFGAMKAAAEAKLSRCESAMLAALAGSLFVSATIEASLWQMWRPSAAALGFCVAALAIATDRKKLLHSR